MDFLPMFDFVRRRFGVVAEMLVIAFAFVFFGSFLAGVMILREWGVKWK